MGATFQTPISVGDLNGDGKPDVVLPATGSREDAVAPLLRARGKAGGVTRAVIAREITKLPKAPATTRAFQDAFEKTPVKLSIPSTGRSAREVLLDAGAALFDASLVPWILKNAQSMKGDDVDLESIREASMLTMLKLAKRDQMKLVDQIAVRARALTLVGRLPGAMTHGGCFTSLR